VPVIAEPTATTQPPRRHWEARIQDIEAVLGELKWRRVRRRLILPLGVALLCNVGTVLMIFILRHLPLALWR
jgi:hypothetical protein